MDSEINKPSQAENIDFDSIKAFLVRDLDALLKIESVAGAPKENAPFGENVREALDLFLSTAKDYGLKCGELDGYCGYAEYGDGSEMIGILGHLDIVAAGGGWSVEPYGLTLKDGYLYGRGVVDNKGCAVLALHILKSLKDSGVKLKHRVRLIVGCNEESGSACLKYYSKHGEIPKMSIVPDSDFPVINSEKGILHLNAAVAVDSYFKESVLMLRSGTAPNVVPDSACIRIKNGSSFYNALSHNGSDCSALPLAASRIMHEEGLYAKDFSFDFSDAFLEIKTVGIAGHAMRPEVADNAAFKILALLDGVERFINGNTATLINESICKSSSLRRIGLDLSDEETGKLTMSLGIAEYDGSTLNLTLDFRLPISVKYTDVVQKVKDFLPEGSDASVLRFAENLYIAEDNPLIQTLLRVYAEETGLKPYTVQTGGGTYARELPNAVAFGPTFPGASTNIHNIDEKISIEQFEKLYSIYYKAILALDNL